MLVLARGRFASVAALAFGLSLHGCSQEPLPDRTYDRQPLSGEVFRVFCMRTARAAYPEDVSGDRFYPLCDGEEQPSADEAPRFRALLERRPAVIAALEQTFAERPGAEPFVEDEIGEFMRGLVELYDLPHETIPKTTRGIAQVLERLRDPDDEKANAVLATIARLSARTGYRTPDNVLGALRPLLTYERLDVLSRSLLKEVAEGGSAHAEFIDVLEALALELADEAAAASGNESTLSKALALLFASDDRLAGASGPALVLRRDAQGNAATRGDRTVTPFPVLGRDDAADERDDESLLAMSGGKPLYETFDANRTVLAAGMRETSILIAPEDDDRSPLQYTVHGIVPLLGPWGERTKQIGSARHTFRGPDLRESPLLDFLHAMTSMARYPETERLLAALAQLLEQSESEATALVYAALRIDELADDSEFDGAKLTGFDGQPGSPHEFWDDLIAAAQRMAKRPGLFEGLVRSFADPRSGVQGKLFANWMRFKDEVSYPNSPSSEPAEINKPVEHTYTEPVDRTEPDVGMNRSIWQRTMSMIHSLNGVKICNKDKAVLIVHTEALGDLTFPSGYPLLSDGYKACELIEMQDAVEVYMRAQIGKGSVQIKDTFATVLASFGELLGITGNVGQIQEQSAAIKGFTDAPTAQSLSRFMYAPRNKFLTDLFAPPETIDKLPLLAYEPNGLFPMEVLDPDASVGGEPQSFLTAGVPMVEAFDAAELRDPLTGQLTDGYMFGHLMSVVHKHWPSPKDEPCPAEIGKGDEGCTQRLDPSAPLYAPQTNLVSYEPLVARALDDEDLLGHLQRAAAALSKVTVDGKDGAKILGEFVQRMVTPDPALAKRNGDKFTKTNSCELVAGASRSCKGGRGRIVEQLTPLHLLLDSLKRFDDVFAEPQNEERHEAWLTSRSKLVDLLLSVDEDGGKYGLRDRDAYAIAVASLPWARDRLAEHRMAGDLDKWASELSGRLETVLSHPLAAGVVALLDKFWDLPDAAREFERVVSAMTNEAENEEAYRGMLIAMSDMLTLIDRDPDLSPAVQFAALAVAPNAFEAVDGQAAPDVAGGALAAGLELAKRVVALDDKTPSTLAKLLANAVRSDGEARAPFEVFVDAAADVNRTELDAPPEQALSAEEDRHAFGEVQEFLSDQDRGLERLYRVIQGRKVGE